MQDAQNLLKMPKKDGDLVSNIKIVIHSYNYGNIGEMDLYTGLCTMST